MQDYYQRKLEEVSFDAEHDLHLERHTRLCPPSLHYEHYLHNHHHHHRQQQESLDYNDDDDSLVYSVSVDSATASVMDTRWRLSGCTSYSYARDDSAMEAILDDTVETGYTRHSTQSDAVTAKAASGCSGFMGEYIGNVAQGAKCSETLARSGSMLCISRRDDYSAMDTIDSKGSYLPGCAYGNCVLNEHTRHAVQKRKEATTNTASHWMCASGFMDGMMDHHDEDTTFEETIARRTMFGQHASIPAAEGSPGRRNDDVSTITRGTANSTETDISQLTERIKQIMADSTRDMPLVEVEDNRSTSSNKTLAEKLEALNRSRNHKTERLMNQRPSSDEVHNKSLGTRLEAVKSGRTDEVEPLTNRGRNEAMKQVLKEVNIAKTYVQAQQNEAGSKSFFWQSDGVWSSDQSRAFGSALHNTRLSRINVVQQEYDEAIASARCLLFTENATGKQEADTSHCWRAAIDASSGKTHRPGHNGSVRRDKWYMSAEEQTKSTNERKVVNSAKFQDVDLSRAKTQKQLGSGVYIEERDAIIGSKGSQSKEGRLEEKQLQDVPAVRQLQLEASPRPSEEQQSNCRQHHLATAIQDQEQEKNIHRRRRFSLYRKKSSKEITSAPNAFSPSSSSSSAGCI